MKFSIAKLLFVTLILLFIGINNKTHAQDDSEVKTLLTEAQKQYSESNYTRTIEICNRILTKKPEFVGAQMLLSYVYDETKKPELELHHLNEASKLNDHPYIKWRLGEVYYKLGNYSEALYYYNIYSNYKYISEKIRFTLACKRASCIFNIQSLQNYVNNNRFTDSNDEYWATPSPDGKKLFFIQEDRNLNELKPDDNFISGDTLSNEFSEQINDSVFTDENRSDTIIADPEVIFFTGYNREDGFGDDDIYFSRFIAGKWSLPANAGSNLNSEKSEAQPHFTPETKHLYFTSNRIGSIGEKDIWRAELIRFGEDGLPVWSTPENIEAVNTRGNEISPFFHLKTQQLYFASNNHSGMGGYDLYEADVENSGSVGELVNLGYPVNTNADELGLVISLISDTAYFSAARVKGEGLEIFSFNLTRGLSTGSNFYVHVKVVNQNSGFPIQTKLEVVDQNSGSAENKLENINKNGELMLCLRANRNYTFNISEKDFMFFSKSVTSGKLNSISDPFEFNIGLEPIEVGSEIDLYNIYYETNSYVILPQSEMGLQKLISFLENNNGVKVEIQGHTDNTGNSENNMELSGLRAKSVVDYLISNNIGLSRLKFAGYGDTLPIESNETETGRQLNRRTTVKITEN